ncbi:hypothetical protein ACI3KS_09000 [Microbacterium sp. ZW T5_45]|uniref:hypothetical protein n=1 Tax=Microbacterium sp. ZW T5_45 TaxID=3378080 RepID=UPI0038525CAA
MTSARRRRRRSGAAWFLAGVLALTGCVSSGARGDFAREFRSDSAIAELELTTADNMPFTEGVRATLTATDGLDSPSFADLVTRLSAFIRQHPDEPVLVTVSSENVTVPVFGDDGMNTGILDAAADIAGGDGVESVEFTTSEQDEITGVSVVINADIAAAFAMTRSSSERVATIGSPTGVHVTVNDSGTAVRISGVPGRWLDDAEIAWTIVSAASVVTGVRADDTRVILAVGDEADVPSAQNAMRETDAVFETPIAFESPLVLLGLGGTGDDVRTMLAALDDESRGLIRYVWTDASRAEFSVASDADIAPLQDALDALPTSARGGMPVTVSVARR